AGADLIVGLLPDANGLSDQPGIAAAPMEGPKITLDLCREAVEDLGAEIVVHGTLAQMPDIALRVRAQKAVGSPPPGPLPERLRVAAPLSAMLLFDGQGARLRAPARRLHPSPEVAR
ncbi:MAG: hypothetical protein AB7S99_04935, partial [Pseudodonghicola sp.]